jgi:hypothetical protein
MNRRTNAAATPHGGRQVWLSGDARINSVRLRLR